MQKEIETACQAALKKKDDIAIALALSPFAQKTAELVNSGAYEAAASSCYAIFRCLAKTRKEHEDWFSGFTGYGDTYTKLAISTEAGVELYCHLRQKPDLVFSSLNRNFSLSLRLCLENTHTRKSKKILIVLLFAHLIVSLSRLLLIIGALVISHL